MISLDKTSDVAKTWLRQRSKRERAFVALGGIVLSAVVLFYGLVQPAYTYRAEQIAQHAYHSAGFSWLRTAMAQGLSPGAEAPSTTSPNLIRTLTRTASSFQITLSRQQPSNSGVSVEIRDHSFDKVVRWLDSLAESHGIKVYSAT
ncbi:MAG: type II secretion system protein GspM, partial [Gammaproteobacteria bacterium]|nr:type II secretion system protein GspM [Gammaproteobacteria bacterium]